MKVAGVFLVTGARAYRGHPSGATFEATMDAAAAGRAVERGDIRLLVSKTPSLQPGSYQLPAGWIKQQEEVHDRG